MPATIGYWKIRGLAQPIRLLLSYAGAEFNEDRYEQGEAPEYSRDEWDKVKHKLDLPFTNLPYLIDGDIKIVQSNAILRYLGTKYNLLGENPKVQAESEMFLETAMDIRNGLVRLAYGPDYDKNVDSYFERTESMFSQLNKLIENRKWFAGGKEPTICDFHLYEMIDQHRLMRPDFMKKFPNLIEYATRFENLPKIKAYMASSSFLKRPCNNKSANWK